jgi:hypothetical protein
MGGFHWIANNWTVLLSAIGVVGGLLFNGFSLRSETKTRRITNLLTLTQNHREIWTELFRNPRLSRVLSPTADMTKLPITCDEETFVGFVILHLSSSYYALRDQLVVNPEGLRQDIRCFLSLPIPAVVWERLKLIQNDDFVEFVEHCRICR